MNHRRHHQELELPPPVTDQKIDNEIKKEREIIKPEPTNKPTLPLNIPLAQLPKEKKPNGKLCGRFKTKSEAEEKAKAIRGSVREAKSKKDPSKTFYLVFTV